MTRAGFSLTNDNGQFNNDKWMLLGVGHNERGERVKGDSSSTIDWARVYPQATHRWHMGLQRGDAAAFFGARDATGAVLAERARWLSQKPETYSALLPEALPALHETAELARAIGVEIGADLTPSERLLALGRAWETDFVWMHPGIDGQHRLIGGVVCFPSAWALRDKLGHAMDLVHAPVPNLNATLGRAIEIFLSKLQPGEAWLRENANFSGDAELNHHPSRPRRKIDATIAIEEFWIRFEHQLLLKLPASGSVLFGIRVEALPFTTVAEDADAMRRLAQIFATISPEAAAYKGIADARAALIALCSY